VGVFGGTYRLVLVLLAHAFLLGQRLLAFLELCNGLQGMVLGVFAPAVVRSAVAAQQQAAVRAKVGGRALVALLALERRLSR